MNPAENVNDVLSWIQPNLRRLNHYGVTNKKHCLVQDPWLWSAAMEIIKTPTREAWLAARSIDVTSTEVGALFGVSPYLTHFELWHRKKSGALVEIEETERMKWGVRLESAIANGIAEDQGWVIRPMKEYMRLPELRMGSSFDFEINGTGILEIKNVDSLAFKQGWGDDDTDEIPLHIEIQVQHQLAVSGKDFSYVGVLVGGNRVVLVKRDPNPDIITGIKRQVGEFWRSIEAGTPPEPDFKRDAAFIAKLYRYAEPGKVLDASDNKEIAQLCADYKSLSDHMKILETKKDEIKARLLMAIGDTEKVIGPDWTVSAGVVGPTLVPAHERKGYRSFRISWKGKKK